MNLLKIRFDMSYDSFENNGLTCHMTHLKIRLDKSYESFENRA